MKRFASSLQDELNKRQAKAPHLSPCCQASLDIGMADGVMVGNCSKCHKHVTRINPKTGVAEWLDGNSIWFKGDLRPMNT
ncbi:MAG: hypothetical protein HZC02_02615 [Candidatus Levybacteria bacterium]|nr:hypothetical protein [Candidatus Levybacteria bacterium]